MRRTRLNPPTAQADDEEQYETANQHQAAPTNGDRPDTGRVAADLSAGAPTLASRDCPGKHQAAALMNAAPRGPSQGRSLGAQCPRSTAIRVRSRGGSPGVVDVRAHVGGAGRRSTVLEPGRPRPAAGRGFRGQRSHRASRTSARGASPLALAALWSPALTSGNHTSTTHLSPESPSTRVSQLVGQERRMCLNAVICVSFVAQLDHPPYCVRCTTVTPPPEPNVQELTAGPPAEGQFANS